MANPLARLLAQQLGGQTLLGFGPLMLTKTAGSGRTPGAASGGTNPTSTAYPCKGRQGVKRSAYWQFWQNAQTNSMARASFVGISILGATLPDAVTPMAGDRITHKGTVYTIAADGVTNPDGVGAIYECMCRAPGG